MPEAQALSLLSRSRCQERSRRIFFISQGCAGPVRQEWKESSPAASGLC